MDFDRNRSRLELTSAEMQELIRMAAGDADPAACDERWVEAGIVVDGEVHPVAGGMIAVALDAPRAASIRRFDGERLAPLFVGIDQRGRATLTEAPGHGAADDAAAWITATRVELLPALLMQAVRLHTGLPDPADREPIDATAGMINDIFEGLESQRVVEVPEDGLDPLGELLLSLENGWQAAGGWQRRDADTFASVLSAGRLGLWFVETDLVADGEQIDRDKLVRLVPCTVAEATAKLGDVVTGRRAPRPGVADGAVA